MRDIREYEVFKQLTAIGSRLSAEEELKNVLLF